MAGGIAVAQQPNWKKEWPVYMVLCKGFVLTFFKAQFSETLLENVKKGNDGAEIFKVKQLNLEINVSLGEDLVIMTKIFSVIKNELMKRE